MGVSLVSTSREGLQNSGRTLIPWASLSRENPGHEADQPWPELVDEENAQARVPRRNGTCGALEGTGADHRAALAEEQDRQAAIRHRDDAANSLPAALVRSERPGDGRGVARRAA